MDLDQDEVLEKMLKEAETLACKISHNLTRSDDGDSSFEPRSPQQKPRPAVENIAQEQGDNDIDEILRASEALLGRMRAETSASSSIGGSEKKSGIAFAACASTAFMLNQKSSIEDVSMSSVGSSSMRASLLSSTPDDSKPFVASKDNLLPLEDPTEAKVAVFANGKIRQTPQIKIPDFNVTSPDAKWEKVTSAIEGDEDFVPLVDHTLERKKSTSQTSTFAQPTASSRLEAYRERTKDKQRCRQRMIIGATAMTFASFLFLLYRYHDGGGSRSPIVHQPKSELLDVQSKHDGAAFKGLQANCEVERGESDQGEVDSKLEHLKKAVNSDGEIKKIELQPESVASENASPDGIGSIDMSKNQCQLPFCAPVREDFEDATITDQAGRRELSKLNANQKNTNTNATNDVALAEGSLLQTKPSDQKVKSSQPEGKREKKVDGDQPLQCRNIFARLFAKKCKSIARTKRVTLLDKSTKSALQ